MTPAIAPLRARALASRRVAAETLDQLAPADPRAMRARRDLRRLHRVMSTARLLRQAITCATGGRMPRRVLEIGCGDGWLLSAVGRQLRWQDAELTLLDRQPVIGPAVHAAGARHGWCIRTIEADAQQWLAQHDGPRFDLVVATLFLHHFDDPALARLLRAVAARTEALAAIEPRRGLLPLVASHLVVLTGAGAVTRGDAVLSVRAGFSGVELSRAWPQAIGWRLHEHEAGAFSHAFIARRAGRRDA